MNSAVTAKLGSMPLFHDCPMEWEEPLRSLGWALATPDGRVRREGTLRGCRADGRKPLAHPGLDSAGLGGEWELALAMVDFLVDGNPWHTIALEIDGYRHPEHLILWGWKQLLGTDPYQLAEGGVAIANGGSCPGVAAECRVVTVLFRIKGASLDMDYLARPSTPKGFSPGRVVSPEMGYVTAPGSAHADGTRFGLFRSHAGLWEPATRMLKPSALPELPSWVVEKLVKPAVKRSTSAPTSFQWKGTERLFAGRLFGKNPDGSPMLLQVSPPDVDSETDVSFWRTAPGSTPQVMIKRSNNGTLLFGFPDEELARGFGAVASPLNDAYWHTYSDLTKDIALPKDEDDAPPPPLPRWSFVEADLGAARFLFGNNLFPTREVTAIVGRPKKALKSWLGAELAAAVSTGLPLGPIPNISSEPMGVLYLTKESESEQKGRIRDQISRMCSERNHPELIRRALSNIKIGEGLFRSDDESESDEGIRIGNGSISEILVPWCIANDISLVVFDTLGKYLPPRASTTNHGAMLHDVGEFVSLAKAINGAVVYTHHSPKGDPLTQLGSQGLDGEVAQMLFLQGDGRKTSATLVSRFLANSAEPLQFEVHPQPGGGGHVRHAATPFSKLRPEDFREGDMQVMALLRQHLHTQCHELTRTVVADAFRRAAGTEDGGKVLSRRRSLGNAKSGTLRDFIEASVDYGWLRESGKVGKSNGYKLGECPHQSALI